MGQERLGVSGQAGGSIYRGGRIHQWKQAGQGEGFDRLLTLERLKPGTGALAKKQKVAPQGFRSAGGESAEPLAQQDSGPPGIAPLQVDVGNGDLQDSLENGAQGALGFMPELLETIVAVMPLARIEQRDRLLQSGIHEQNPLLGGAGLRS